MNSNKIKSKIYTLEYLESIVDELNNKAKYINQEYVCLGKSDRQKKKYIDGQWEYLWEDEDKTIPLYEDEWGYVPKSELSDEDKLRLECLNSILHHLEKLV